MKRQASQRVSKRDGRFEWLRVTKLARSIGRAISAARGVDYDALYPPSGFPYVGDEAGLGGEAWRTLELGAAVLTGLRQTLGAGATLSAEDLSEAVQQVLFANGMPRAAEAYARARGEQLRRSLVLEVTMPSLQAGLASFSGAVASDRRRSSRSSHRPPQPPRPLSNPNDFRHEL